MNFSTLARGLLFFTSLSVFGQVSASSPVFEVASIKPADPAASGSRTNANQGRLTMTNVTLKQCILMAYHIQGYQLSGGPSWLDTARYDISAKMDAAAEQLSGQLARARMETMLQNLLADRFKLIVRRESKQTRGYVLMVSKNGPKLKRVQDDDRTSTNVGRGKVTARRISMSEFATRLSGLLDRPVRDLTGLAGVFELTLEWTPDDNQAGLNAGGNAKAGTLAEARIVGPTIFTALQEQLGLKLESQNSPIDILTIDHAEKAYDN
jgi:bla regulator protein blaR1